MITFNHNNNSPVYAQTATIIISQRVAAAATQFMRCSMYDTESVCRRRPLCSRRLK